MIFVCDLFGTKDEFSQSQKLAAFMPYINLHFDHYNARSQDAVGGGGGGAPKAPNCKKKKASNSLEF